MRLLNSHRVDGLVVFLTLDGGGCLEMACWMVSEIDLGIFLRNTKKTGVGGR